MKPASFDYFAPTTLDETLALLHENGEEGKILAGGPGLMPLMNFRLSPPPVIIDINRISGPDHITSTADGGVAIGALTRLRAVEKSPLVRQQNPLLAAAMPLIGHFQIRNRGTVGGSFAHADPAAALPALAVLLRCGFSLVRQGCV